MKHMLNDEKCHIHYLIVWTMAIDKKIYTIYVLLKNIYIYSEHGLWRGAVAGIVFSNDPIQIA